MSNPLPFYSAIHHIESSRSPIGRVALGHYPVLNRVAVARGREEVGYFREDEFREFAAKVLGDTPKTEETKPESSAEKVTRLKDGVGLEVQSRVNSEHTIKAWGGGLGDNIILQDPSTGFYFALGLASIQAIVEAEGLEATRKVTIQDGHPDWLDAKVLRVDYDGEEGVLAVRDGEGDWVVHLSTGADWVYDDKHAAKEFTNVEILVRD